MWDLRGYPNGTAFTLPRRLTTEPSIPVAWLGEPRPDGPYPVEPGPAAPTEAAVDTTFTVVPRIPGGGPGARVWRGRSVILADETTQSQAEHSSLILSAAMPGTRAVGSPTAGANGDVTPIALPGGVGVTFSGHDVRWPDGRQLQQVGVRPDVLARPTVAGIRAGRDEVPEAGLAEARRLLRAPAQPATIATTSSRATAPK